MIYVKRNAAGVIVAVSRETMQIDVAERVGWQAVSGDDPDVVAFGQTIAEDVNPLSPTDIGLVRVLEDLIELLVDRSVIRFTDLPHAAQAKLMERRGTRAALQRLGLLDDEDCDVI